MKRLTGLFLSMVLATQLLTGFTTATTIDPSNPPIELGAQQESTPYINGDTNRQLFNDGWKFAKSSTDASGYSFDDSAWQDVQLPHDWLISQVNDLYQSAVVWYRNTFYLPSSQDGKNVTIQFDGVYMDSTVYVNGHDVGNWPYGYTTFQYDITPYLNFGNEPNVISVKINHQSPNSRWYSGSGIYRNVWLTVADPVHVDFNGTYISTKDDDAIVQTEVINTSDKIANVTIVQTVLDADGEIVKTSESSVKTIEPGAVLKDVQTLSIDSPTLWDIDNPYVYRMKTHVKINGDVINEYLTSFGFRTIRMDADEGFFLNDTYMKLKGVCMHHDLGALGAAVNYRALERQMETMKEMGVNSIRTTHNAPTPELLEICDRLGLMVVEEAFDTWIWSKNSNDYAKYFRVWAERDTRNWVRRDRNHPSVIMWSIGNEIAETGSVEETIQIATDLTRYVQEEDPNKNGVVTIGSDRLRGTNINPNNPAQIIASSIVGASGYNYVNGAAFDAQHNAYPEMVMYGAETSSATHSRGIYHFPPSKNSTSDADKQCSSYENSLMNSYAHSAEDAWKWDRDRKYLLGQYIWTGFDYIGEPSPYDTKNSFFGAVDTAGIPKDIFYFYQSIWQDDPVLHLLPYWDWTEGDTIPVWAYTNAHSVELFQDGVSLGKQVFNPMGNVVHLEWDVVYTKGELEAIAYDESGNEIARDKISSFDDPVRVGMTPDRESITADGQDLVFIETSVFDSNDIAVENARNIVEFKVSGAGKLVGVDNGDSTDYDSYQSPARKMFSGKLMAIVQSDGTDGEITITATSNGLQSDSITINTVHKQEVTGIDLGSIDEISAISTNKGTLKIIAKAQPVTADYKKISYTVTEIDGVTPTDKAIIDNNGVLTALKNGQVRVTASSLDGSDISANKTITIINQSSMTSVTSIDVSGGNITSKSGTSQMSAIVNPSSATITNVKWTVENKSRSGIAYASIDNAGLLRASHDGVVTVRATAKDGSAIYGEKDVTITNQYSQNVPARKIDISIVKGSTLLTDTNKTATLKANLRPYGATATTDNLQWSVVGIDGNQTSLATVFMAPDGDGEATVLSNGGNGSFKVQVSTKNGTSLPQVYGFMTFTSSASKSRDAYEMTKAIDFDEIESANYKIENGGLGGLDPNDWAGFKYLDFGTSNSKQIKLTAANGSPNDSIIEIRDGSSTGDLLTTINFAPTGSYSTNATREYDLPDLKGIKELYFIFTNGNLLFDSFQFTQGTKNPYQIIKATTFDDIKSPGHKEENGGLGGLSVNDWAVYKSLDFGAQGSKKIKITAGNGSTINSRIEIRDGSATGTMLATIEFTPTGGYNTYATREYDLPELQGIHDICFVFLNGYFLFDSFQFAQENESMDPYKHTMAKTYDVSSKIFGIENEDALGGINANDWLGFKNVDFGDIGSSQIILTGGLIEAEKTPIELRDGSQTGELLATINFPSTGGWHNYISYVFDLSHLTGKHDLYFVFPKGMYCFKSLQFVESTISTDIQVVNVGDLLALTVENGTAFNLLNLPKTVNVQLSDSTSTDLKVVWDGMNYNPNLAGTYTIKGELVMVDGIENPENIYASIDVIIKDADERGFYIKDFEIKSVTEYGAKVSVTLDNDQNHAQSLYAIIALYNDSGKLTGSKIEQIQISAKGTEVVDLAYESSKKSYCAKFMFCNDNYAPLTEAIEISLIIPQ